MTRRTGLDWSEVTGRVLLAVTWVLVACLGAWLLWDATR